jgi:hypothetical protein
MKPLQQLVFVYRSAYALVELDDLFRFYCILYLVEYNQNITVNFEL